MTTTYIVRITPPAAAPHARYSGVLHDFPTFEAAACFAQKTGPHAAVCVVKPEDEFFPGMVRR